MRDLDRLNYIANELSKNQLFKELIDDFMNNSLNELILSNNIREVGTQDEIVARQVFKKYFENLLDYDNILENKGDM